MHVFLVNTLSVLFIYNKDNGPILYSITTPLLLIAMVASFFGYRRLTSGPNNWKVKYHLPIY